MTEVGRILDIAATRGDGRRWCGLQLLAWTIASPVTAGLAIGVVLCLGAGA